jgi:hypothetical protein
MQSRIAQWTVKGNMPGFVCNESHDLLLQYWGHMPLHLLTILAGYFMQTLAGR